MPWNSGTGGANHARRQRRLPSSTGHLPNPYQPTHTPHPCNKGGTPYIKAEATPPCHPTTSRRIINTVAMSEATEADAAVGAEQTRSSALPPPFHHLHRVHHRCRTTSPIHLRQWGAVPSYSPDTTLLRLRWLGHLLRQIPMKVQIHRN